MRKKDSGCWFQQLRPWQDLLWQNIWLIMWGTPMGQSHVFNARLYSYGWYFGCGSELSGAAGGYLNRHMKTLSNRVAKRIRDESVRACTNALPVSSFDHLPERVVSKIAKWPLESVRRKLLIWWNFDASSRTVVMLVWCVRNDFLDRNATLGLVLF